MGAEESIVLRMSPGNAEATGLRVTLNDNERPEIGLALHFNFSCMPALLEIRNSGPR